MRKIAGVEPHPASTTHYRDDIRHSALVKKVWLGVIRLLRSCWNSINQYAEALPHHPHGARLHLNDQHFIMVCVFCVSNTNTPVIHTPSPSHTSQPRFNPMEAHCHWFTAFHQGLEFISNFRLHAPGLPLVPAATGCIFPQSISILFDLGAAASEVPFGGAMLLQCQPQHQYTISLSLSYTPTTPHTHIQPRYSQSSCAT